MRTIITVVMLSALAELICGSKASFGQVPDTVVVYANPPGLGGGPTFDQFISGDTTATGQRNNPNRVYVLQQTGSTDTLYFITAPLIVQGYNLTIVGRPNPVTGKLPVIVPFIRPDNSSAWAYFLSRGGNITLKNLYLLGRRTDQIVVTNNIINVSADSVRVTVDRCVVDGFNSYTIFFNATKYCNLYVTNCEFRDMVGPAGGVWISAAAPTDTMQFLNNTFFDCQFAAYGELGYIHYLNFQHNTLIFGCWSPLNTPQLWNGVISNNIFYAVASAGGDSTHIAALQKNPGADQLGYAIIYLDTLVSLKNPPFNLTEAMRHVVVENNAYFWPQAIYNYWNLVNDTARNKLIPPQFMDKFASMMFGDHTRWPNLVAEHNDSVDPGFSASLVSAGTDSLVKFMYMLWTKGTAGSFRPIPYLTDPLNVYASVPQSWATTQGYPVPENLAYTNTTLQKAGTDGFALGDLNWFPAQLKLWEQGKPNPVESRTAQVPLNFALSQNYPNPFNPSTRIKVSLSHSGIMSLKIYNVLGQVVEVVDQGYKQAGEYTYDVNMNKFGSGVYIYMLREGENVIMKKMVLLK